MDIHGYLWDHHRNIKGIDGYVWDMIMDFDLVGIFEAKLLHFDVMGFHGDNMVITCWEIRVISPLGTTLEASLYGSNVATPIAGWFITTKLI